VAPTARHANLFPGAQAPRLPNFNEADQSDKPPTLRLATRDAAWIRYNDEVYRGRLRSAQAIDEGLEQIVRDLQLRQALANTFIVFTGDNGFEHGEHRLSNTKSFAYEESVRLPLYVRGPGVPRGRVISQLVSNADLAPTFAAWAGVTPPEEVDGRSFAALLGARDPATVPWRKAVRQAIMREPPKPLETTWLDPVIDPAITKGYGCIGRGVAPVFSAQMRGVRTQRYAFTHQTTGAMELYDRATDPYELDNAICGVNPNLRQRLRDLAADLETCHGDGCRALEDTPVP
jgi:N-acetylglucosamine-6-sulfatase